jgi:rhamnose utilization protein RhaD (predicted bifunctional aldolase and dehydrogenase)
VLASDEDETEGALLFLLVPFGRPGLELPELLAIGQNQIHVFVKGFELADEGSSVLEDDAHSIVQMRRHLVTLAHSHLEGRKNWRERGFEDETLSFF